jgi:hypothetical protein
VVTSKRKGKISYVSAGPTYASLLNLTILSRNISSKYATSYLLSYPYSPIAAQWAGYDSDVNTWEPVESFSSYEVIEEFWKHVSDDRDVLNNPHLVSVGDEFQTERFGPPKGTLDSWSFLQPHHLPIVVIIQE